MAKLLVKCEGNNSPKYDGKIWEEDLKFVVNVNGQTIDLNSNVEVKPGDRVTVKRPGKGGKNVRYWHGVVMSESGNVEEAAADQSSSTRKRKHESKRDSDSSKKPKCKYVHFLCRCT